MEYLFLMALFAFVVVFTIVSTASKEPDAALDNLVQSKDLKYNLSAAIGYKKDDCPILVYIEIKSNVNKSLLPLSVHRWKINFSEKQTTINCFGFWGAVWQLTIDNEYLPEYPTAVEIYEALIQMAVIEPNENLIKNELV